jgi:uncharacterized RDD family membrane protein YckC
VTGVFSGEAVRLELPEAGLSSRIVALTIDLIVELIVLFAVLMAAGFVMAGLDDAAGAAVGLVAMLAVILAMPVTIETLMRGRSVGKLAMGIRVVRDDGGPVRFRHSLVRGIFLVLVDLWTTAGSVGLITSLANEKGKRVGDFFAGTIVVRDRFPTSLTPPRYPEPVPPHLAQWAQSLPMSKLSNSVATSAASFLTRRTSLDPRARIATAGSIATAVAEQLGTPAPSANDAETFLLVVVQEKERRDWS